ncbi:MAG: glycosyltransferase family 39 protein [Anaerolineales bacterium]|nr:glycosyltransferase family 39 protein [Anaerolineales bacterium]MCW5854505.1 glycosyltransferase family 39 protein [Anaerolineales bacterium]
MNKLRSLPLPLRLFGLALLLRLLPVLLAVHLPIGLDDMFQYDMLARSLAAGQGFRWYGQEDIDLIRQFIAIDFIGDYDPRGVLTSFRAPGYPALLAAIYAISGLQWRLLAARLAQAVLGASLAPLTYWLTQRLFPGNQQAARFAGGALAVYPMLLLYPLALATENLFIPLVAAGLLATLAAVEHDRARDYLLAGALFGLATLTRSVIFGFVGLAVLWLWFYAPRRSAALYFLLAVLVFVVPWSLRNSLLHGKPTFVENSMGYNLHMGFHPQGNGTFQFGISLELVPYLDDSLRNDLGTQAGLEFIRQDPGRALRLAADKLGFFFSLERRALTYFYGNDFFGHIPSLPLAALFAVFTLPFPLLTSLAAAGLPFAGRLAHISRQRVLLYLLIAGYTLPHLILIAEDRFHMALLPGIAALAGDTWTRRAELTAAARAQRWRLGLAALLLALLWLNWGGEIWRDWEKLTILFGPEGNRAGFSY